MADGALVRPHRPNRMLPGLLVSVLAVATTVALFAVPSGGTSRSAVAALALLAVAAVVATDRAGRNAHGRLAEEHAAALAGTESLERGLAATADERDRLHVRVVDCGRQQERLETMYRVGRRLAGETDSDVIARVGLAGLCALVGSAGGIVVLADGRRVVFGNCPPELGESASCARGLSMAAAPWGATVRIPLARGTRTFGAAHVTLPAVDDIAALDGPSITHVSGQMAVALDYAQAFQAAHQHTGIIRAVLDATPDAIHLVDNDGTVVLSNAPFRSVIVPLLGPQGGVGARRASEVPRVTDADAFVRDVVSLRSMDPQQAIHEFQVDHAARTFVRFTAPVRNRSGDRLGRVFVHRDVTAERESDRMKDEFLALVSHELRTPLTSVMGYLELVLDDEAGPLAADQRRLLEVSERNARRLLHLIGDVLLIAQAEAGRLDLIGEETDLGVLIAEHVEAAAPAADEAGVALRSQLEDDATLVVDRKRVGQVLDNLIGNALRYAGSGSSVTVALRRTHEGVRLSVSDTGPGIPSDDLPHIFDSFYRGASASTKPGTGLGLAVCQLIARAHDGRMDVSSCPDAGAEFTLVLPDAPSPARRPLTAITPVGAGTGGPLQSSPIGG